MTAFFVGELTGALIADSVALQADGVHSLIDLLALVSLFGDAPPVSEREAT